MVKKGLTPLLTLCGACLGAYILLRTTRSSEKSRPSARGPRIVILGAGFAGLAAARKLSHHLGRSARITLIDERNYHLFTPMLYQAAVCSVAPYDIAYPIREFTSRHGVTFRRGAVTGVDWSAHRVQLDNGSIEYDYLIIALGSTTNYFGNTGVQEHTLPMKHLEDGIAIRNRVADVLDQAAITSDPDTKKSLLTFVVVGGGATGVETAAELRDFLREVLLQDYRQIEPDQARILVIESEDHLLGHMGARLARLALERLSQMGIEVWLNARAKEVTPGAVTTDDGRRIQAGTVIWTAGVRAPDVVARLDAPHGKGGGLVVDEYLQVRDHPGVYAVGDNAHVEDPQTGRLVPLLAQAAADQGTAVAENIVRAIQNHPQLPFHYHELGNVLAMGHSWGAVEIGGLVVAGLPGWFGWRLIHLYKLSSFRNRVATALDWVVGILYNEDIARLEVEPIGKE